MVVLDIGATHTRVGFFKDGRLRVEKFDTSHNWPEQLEKIRETVGRDDKAVVGIAGSLNGQKDSIIRANNLRGFVNLPIKNDLEEALGAKVFLENDADLAGLGEALEGAGVGFNAVVFLTLSTGVGGAKIKGGRISPDPFEPEHMEIEYKGERVELEQLISGSGLEKRYGREAKTLDDPKIWEEVTDILIMGIAEIINHWSPDVIILGGPISTRVDLERVSSRFTQPVKLGTLGDNAALIGGLEYLKSNP